MTATGEVMHHVICVHFWCLCGIDGAVSDTYELSAA